MIKIIRLF